MNVGFYYHVGVATDGGVALPAHMAMFVEELARRAGSVTYLAHSGLPSDADDTVLSPPLVRTVNIGPRHKAPIRSLTRSVRAFDPASVDVLLVRAPTPLLTALVRSAPRVAVLLVGTYESERSGYMQPRWREALIGIWVRHYNRQQRRVLHGRLIMANSRALARQAAGWGGEVVEVFTSSLSGRDLDGLTSERAQRTAQDPLRLLYTGRISEEKGLMDAVDVVARLSARGWNPHLDLVGPADDERFTDALHAQARDRGVDHLIEHRGYVRAGRELLRMYVSADVFLMPSRNDAFPRSLVEALAVGTPVVATRVGGIPDRLVHERTALLVEPGSPGALADAVERLASDDRVRSALVEEGRNWARGFTNERSCELIVGELRKLLGEAC